MALSAQEYACILKNDLTSFIEGSFYELHPGHILDLAPHIEVMATKLEAVRRGEIEHLIINLPPRHLKSHCVTAQTGQLRIDDAARLLKLKRRRVFRLFDALAFARKDQAGAIGTKREEIRISQDRRHSSTNPRIHAFL